MILQTGSVDSARPSGAARSSSRRLWLAGVVGLLLLFLCYSVSFRSFPIIDRQHSVLADADAANFKLLVEDFGLGTRFGDERNAIHRGLGDTAQKHKIHHLLYAMVGHQVYLVLRAAYTLLGLPAARAVYSVNAVITCFNLLLLALVMRGQNPRSNPTAPFLIFYAASLSTWLYGSVPESWPFSGTLVIGFLWLLQRERLHPALLAALLGVFMLNNLTLGALLVLLWLRLAGETPEWGKLVLRVASASVLTVGVWAGALWLLSFFDGSLRPDRLIGYTLWFKHYVAADLPLTSPYVWKSALSNLFINSLASNQSDPTVPQEALLLTLRQSRLGLVAVIGVASLLALTAVRLFQATAASLRSSGWRPALLREAGLRPAVYCLVMVGVTVVMYYGAGFLYSTTVVPMLALAMCRYLDLSRRLDLGVLCVTLGLMVVNNAEQVVKFREALRLMS